MYKKKVVRLFGPWKDRPENFRSLRGKVPSGEEDDRGSWDGGVTRGGSVCNWDRIEFELN